MTIRRSGTGAALVLLAAWACTDETPTSGDRSLIPVEATTYEVILPFDFFGRDFQVFGGFDSQAGLGEVVLARDWRGDMAAAEGPGLDSHPLIQFGPFPEGVTTQLPGGSEPILDTLYTPISGELTVFFDTVGVEELPEVAVSAGATQSPWQLATASWEVAVDTLGDVRDWPEPGGGPVRFLGTESWLPLAGDSVIFQVDSLTLSEWADTGNQSRGLRLSAETEGVRVRVRDARLRFQAIPSMNPDTLVETGPTTRQMTFIYYPVPPLSSEAFQIGGAPARRATMRIELPTVLDGNEEVCEFLPCPLELQPEALMHAALVLNTRPTSPVPFQPRDTVLVDFRPVLAPERLPRSPLGSRIAPVLTRILPDLFREGGESAVEIPMTRYVRELLQARLEGGEGPPTTISMLSPVEPRTLEFATFQGPGAPGAPGLRLILTVSEGTKVP